MCCIWAGEVGQALRCLVCPYHRLQISISRIDSQQQYTDAQDKHKFADVLLRLCAKTLFESLTGTKSLTGTSTLANLSVSTGPLTVLLSFSYG